MHADDQSAFHFTVPTCRNHNRPSVSHRAVLLLVEDEFDLPLFDPQELVGVLLHLFTESFTRYQVHHYKPGVLSGE